jgi:hypothetical protein
MQGAGKFVPNYAEKTGMVNPLKKILKSQVLLIAFLR